MKAVVQRVTEAHVAIDGNVHARIGKGLMILIGIKRGDAEASALYLADKCSSMRIFEDDDANMNRSLKEVDGSVLIVSQFTLNADTRKGNRPNLMDAAPPAEAIPLYESFVRKMKMNLGEHKVHTGVFGAMMEVHLVNQGPVTILMEHGGSYKA